jgi:hypothetical protein
LQIQLVSCCRWSMRICAQSPATSPGEFITHGLTQSSERLLSPPESCKQQQLTFSSREITFNNCYRSQPRAERVVNIILSRISPGSKSTYPRLTLSFAGTLCIRVQSGARDSHLRPAVCAQPAKAKPSLADRNSENSAHFFFSSLSTCPWERGAC